MGQKISSTRSSKFDYEKLGFKAGLEIHAQLDTKTKLFCRCPAQLRTDGPHFYIKRFFRPVMSELGEFDKAMLREYEKGLTIIYEGWNDTTCTYELDETPPFPPSDEAVDIAILISLLLNCDIVDEIHVCRKNYLDGSVPCGFQRTMLIGINGYVPINGKKIGIQYVYLEEDAARKDDEKSKGKTIYYKLDRLGIPLVEIVTAPDMRTPEEVVEAARRIGLLLRASGKTRRGLGTIRQDINVSIEGGARVELKGIQLLEMIPVAIDMEIARQLELLKIRDELTKRGVKEEDLKEDFFDVTDVFKNTKSKIIKRVIKSGGKVYAVKLKGFAGILGWEIQPNRRFGTELADRVKAYTTLRGILHTDENLKDYGISDEELQKLFKIVQKGEQDAVVIVAGDADECIRALRYVVERARIAIRGVPSETRGVHEDGTSSFQRELHGQARLYPDTDMPPIPLPEDRIDKIRKSLPEPPWDRIKRLAKEYEIDEQFAEELVKEGFADLFEEVIREYKVPSMIVATTLLQTTKALSRDGIPVENLTDSHFRKLFEYLAMGRFAKEAIPEILTHWAKNPDIPIDDVLRMAGVRAMSLEELERIVDEIVSKNIELIKSRRERAFKPLMGDVMRVVRGKIDGKTVSEVLKRKIDEVLKKL